MIKLKFETVKSIEEGIQVKMNCHYVQTTQFKPIKFRKLVKARMAGEETIENPNYYDLLKDKVGEFVKIWFDDEISTRIHEIKEVKEDILIVEEISRQPAPVYTLGSIPKPNFHWTEPLIYYYSIDFIKGLSYPEKLILPNGEIVLFDEEKGNIDMSKCEPYIGYDVIYYQNGERKGPYYLKSCGSNEDGIWFIECEKSDIDEDMRIMREHIREALKGDISHKIPPADKNAKIDSIKPNKR